MSYEQPSERGCIHGEELEDHCGREASGAARQEEAGCVEIGMWIGTWMPIVIGVFMAIVLALYSRSTSAMHKDPRRKALPKSYTKDPVSD